MSVAPLDRLDGATVQLLAECGRIAAARSEAAYLVGGPVRDLLLGRNPEDVDVLVVGDGLAVAQALARSRDGKLTRFHAFGTARVELPAGTKVDVATARSEAYERPAALPRVEPGTLEEDLGRRDFAINSLAVALSPEGWGRLHDPFGGAADLDAGRIRVLHGRSFADDPTRLLRAVRFAVRFGYELDEATRRAFDDAVQGRLLDRLTGDRLRREVAKSLDESPIDGSVALRDRGLLAALHPGLTAERSALEAVTGAADAADLATTERWPVVLAVLAAGLAPQERQELARRLRLARHERLPLVDAGAPWRRAARALESARRRSEQAAALDGLAAGGIAAVLCVLEARESSQAEVLRRYLVEDRHVASELDGAALRAMGYGEGPEVGRALRRLRAARLDGDIRGVDEERRLAAELLDGAAN